MHQNLTFAFAPLRHDKTNAFSSRNTASLIDSQSCRLREKITAIGMPYTPPSHQSPASSTCSSPNEGRGSSSPARRGSLPRSSSYTRKHQRKSSLSDGSSPGTLTPQGTSEDLTSLSSAGIQPPHLPWADELVMPHGAVISPPDSASSGSDDESIPQIRGRPSGKTLTLKTPVAPPPKAKSPPPQCQQLNHFNATPAWHAPTPKPKHEGDTHRNMHLSLSLAALDGTAPRHQPRKVSHVRSATEPQVAIASSSSENSDDDEDLASKPPMVRKKSGELVRPALRPSSRRRPSSMPGTPVSSKAVHFDSHLEHIRHFLQVDRPLAVSAGSSPVESYENETEYPFLAGGQRAGGVRSPPFEWEMMTPNFPHHAPSRAELPVKLEKLWLSSDQKCLLGFIAVANLAFQKHVSCRFTFDHWKTTSEVTAEYAHEIRPHDGPLAHDRFSFSIKLSDTANLESKTLYLCLRYAVNGQEFWDNNTSANFQVDFRKKHLPQNGKNNFQGTAGRARNSPLPRSNHRSSGTCSPSSPKPTVSVATQPFKVKDRREAEYGHPLRDYLADTDADNGPGLRLRSKSTQDIASDRLDMSLASPKGVAFSNRYDFGASLSAAVQAARDSMGKDKDTLYMKSNVRPPKATGSDDGSCSPNSSTPSPPSLPSTSYEELVNKYCFVSAHCPSFLDGVSPRMIRR